MESLSLPEFSINPVNLLNKEKIQSRIDNKTKPLGALGQIELLATQLAMILAPNAEASIVLTQPTMVVFAGDHGVAEEGVSIAPSVVTQQMVGNFLAGGAAINCFCRSVGMSIKVVDAGILAPVESDELVSQRLGAGTNNFLHSVAMSRETVIEGIELGAGLIRCIASSGCNVLALGEMGIGNTSSSAALMAALLNKPADECVGRGTGIDDRSYARKVSVIEQALVKHRSDIHSVVDMMACFGGFEIVQMIGAMLAAAEKNMVILVDGFIATVAALYACRIEPLARDYMVFCHQSHEQGHRAMLDALHAQPLLDLSLRLGEGTGAALAYPLLEAAASFYNDMASFESAGVTV